MSKILVDIDKIQELLLSFAEGDYSKRLSISDKRDERDIIISGINMLGEELEESTVSKEYFKSIYDAISDIVIVTDVKGKITSVNKAALDLLEISNENLIGVSLVDVLDDFYDKRDLLSFINGKNASKSFEVEIVIFGQKRIFSSTLSRIHSRFQVQEGILVITKDVTSEKNIEGEILKAIIETEEKEKRRLAYDLHDALGQELNSVKMMFDSMFYMDKNTERFKEVMELCRTVINKCIDSTRLLSYDLMPKTLEDEKLFNAFEEIERNHRGLLNVILKVPESEYDISKVRKINIYRILQEFVTNSLKHGEASEITIESFIENKKYFFIFSDNGKGFDIRKDFNGRGIKNIKTRLKVIGAKYNFSSYSSSGTKLIFSIS